MVPTHRPPADLTPVSQRVYSSRMPGDQVIVLRVSGDAKQRIESAAKTKGQSMTTFILDAATKAAAKVGTPSGARPTFFRALCWEASQGGSSTYFRVGHELARHYSELRPYTSDDYADADTLGELLEQRSDVEAVRVGDFGDEDRAILDWLIQTVPRCMALVPARRYPTFLAGFYSFVDNNGWEY